MGMWPFAARRNGNGAAAKHDVGVNGTGMVFMVVLALQFGLQPLLQTECVDYERVDRVSLVITTEVTKIFLCAFVIFSSGPNIYRPMLASWTLKGSLATAAFPAAVYALQNCLSQVAYVNLDSLTFNLLNQTKTLFAALCLYLVMGKKQSPQQLVALSLLLVAALILNASGEGGGSIASSSNGEAVAAGDGNGDGNATDGNLAEAVAAVAAVAASAAYKRFWLGVVPVVGAALLSGLAGALTQRTLQRSGRNASQLSLELAVYGVGTLLLTSGYWSGGPDGLGKEWWRYFFRGWTPWTWLPVLSQAAGGLLVGQVTKHAGSVSKGFALIGGIFVTAAVQRSMERSALTSAHWIAAVLVAGGTYLHSSYPHRPLKENGKKIV